MNYLFMVLEYQGLKIHWLRHACFRVEFNDKNLYFDPYELFKEHPKADYILITHEHFDHCDRESLQMLIKDGTVIIVPEIAYSCVKEFEKKCKIIKVKPGDSLTINDVKVSTIPSYNVSKFRAPGKVYHPKEDGRVGYIVEIKGVKIYHAGDTDVIPEMRELEGKIDIALLPVSGTYVMTPEEAVDAVKIIKPKIAIPMHYGTIVGTVKDAEKFREKASQHVQVVVLQEED